MPAACLALALCGSAAQGNDGSAAPAVATALMPAARAWVAGLPGAGPQAADFVPMDPRLAATPCVSGWRFDLPFADPRAVRARCEQPRAQIFLRALQALRPADGRAAASTPAPTPAPAAGPASAPPSRPATVSPSAVTAAAPGASASSTVITGGRAGPPDAVRPVVVMRADLRRGERLDPAAIESVQRDEPPRRSFGAPVEDPTTLEHMELVRDKQAGEVLYTHDIQPALLVRRGQLIAVSLQAVPGLRISARLEALQDGRHGQPVRLRNPESGRIVSAIVTGPGEARLP